MDASRLSAITWTVEDRRAWQAAYQHARRIDRARRRRERAQAERAARFEVCQDAACDGYGSTLIDGLCGYSVRVDVLEDRGTV